MGLDACTLTVPFGKPYLTDPTKSTTTLKTVLGVWGSIRDETVVKFWLHHLRHTALTKMAEGGAAMMERYSHIRMAAKREAVDALKFRPREAKTTEGAAKDSTKVAALPLLN